MTLIIPQIQVVFYWVATIALALVGLFMIVAIVAVFYIQSQIARLTRAVNLAAVEVRMAAESVKNRSRGIGASIMAQIWRSLWNFLKR